MQLWYHDAVLYLPPAALSLNVYPMLIINSCCFLPQAIDFLAYH
jgi:hypothetical protein